MELKEAIPAFLSNRSVALAGVSRTGGKFGNTVLGELRNNGYEISLIHPEASEMSGLPCFPSFSALPRPVQSLVVVLPPERALEIVKEAIAAGIRHVWLQQGAASGEAVELCQRKGVNCIHGHCILMFLEKGPRIHRFHHWLWKLVGKAPR